MATDAEIKNALLHFINWLDTFGELSYDHQSFFASNMGRWAKSLYYRKPTLGTLAVSPMVLCEAFLPSARRLFWKPQRFPIADAHYAMGFAYLSQALAEEQYYLRAVHFLEVLKETRCEGYRNYCWGYPFDWETRTGTIKAGTPLITTVPYVYEAFWQVHRIDKCSKWLEIMHSIAEHATADYQDIETSEDASSCTYTPIPGDPAGVVNASAYRALLLTRAAADFADDRYRRISLRNLNFVLEVQNPDGSWYYSTDGKRDFVDHFHTCFVLKALAKIEALTGNERCTQAIERGVQYYIANLLDIEGLPKPFSRKPRLTVYRRELYDCAECINLGVLLRGRFDELDAAATNSINFAKWQQLNGMFRARQLYLGWDNTPMHRWAQSQFFRSLCFLLYQNCKSTCHQTTGN